MLTPSQIEHLRELADRLVAAAHEAGAVARITHLVSTDDGVLVLSDGTLVEHKHARRAVLVVSVTHDVPTIR